VAKIVGIIADGRLAIANGVEWGIHVAPVTHMDSLNVKTPTRLMVQLNVNAFLPVILRKWKQH